MPVLRKNVVTIALLSVGVFLVLVALFLLALLTPIFKRELAQDHATALSNEYLQLVDSDIDAFFGRLSDTTFVNKEEVRELIAASGFAAPRNVDVTRLENHILIGGLDEASISSASGSYTCADSDTAQRFYLQFMYDREHADWLVSDFYVTGC